MSVLARIKGETIWGFVPNNRMVAAGNRVHLKGGQTMKSLTRKVTIGFIPANRGFFSDELAARMRAQTIRAL